MGLDLLQMGEVHEAEVRGGAGGVRETRKIKICHVESPNTNSEYEFYVTNMS